MFRRQTARPWLEELERRDAPAILLDPTTVQFVDSDGDLASIRVTSPAGATLALDDLVFEARREGEVLRRIDVADRSEFTGSDWSITAQRRGGNGRVNVGAFDAAGVDLGAVFMDGDLSGFYGGVQRLKVHSLGKSAGSASIQIHGSVDRFAVVTDVVHGDVLVAGNLAHMTVGGSLRASSLWSGRLDQLTVSGSIVHASVVALHMGEVVVHGRLEGSPGRPASIAALGEARTETVTVTETIYREVIVQELLPDGTIVERVERVPVQVTMQIPVTRVSGGELGSLTVFGSVAGAEITACQIDSVTVEGNWQASNLAVGVWHGPDGQLGTRDDRPLASSDRRFGRIGSLTILGELSGSSRDHDHFGIVAQHIENWQLGVKSRFRLRPGPGNDEFTLGDTSDFRLREVYRAFPPSEVLPPDEVIEP